jgi:endo-1,4-beta-D-glucanase Y
MKTKLAMKKVWIMVVLVLLLAGIMMVSTSQTSANATDPFLWPYNQPTNISFNENDVYQAWVNWRDAQITANNAGGNGRLRVMGGVDNSSTVSEGMGYGILFASIFDEQTTFDGLYLFASDHFNEHGVMDWHIGNPGQLIGEGGATDAEVDMALGLVNACVKVQQGSWPASPRGINYCNAATSLINAIYTYEVDHPGSSPIAGLPNNQGNELIPGDFWNLAEDYPEGIINLSYFPPGYFEVFGKFTNNQAAWNAVINRNYDIVNLVQAKPDNCSGLVPNWNQYDGDAQLVSWQTNNYSWWSYDAARFAWRIAVDQAWYGRSQASETMNEIGGFFSSTGFDNIGEHTMNGQRVGSGPWPFFLANAGSAVWAAPSPNAVNCGTATGTLKESPQSAYNRVLGANDSSYYNGAWRLLAMLLMTGNFPNFYEMAQGNLPTATPGVPTSTPSAPTNTPIPPTATQPSSGGVCKVDYVVSNSWSNVFQANVTVTNNSSSAISGWTLNFTHAPGQTATGGWNATISQSGNNVTISNPASYWNGNIAANGGSATFGLQGTFAGSVVIPTNFVLNGVACNDDTPPPTATSVPPTATNVPPTATAVPPTATSMPPTATSAPPTATSVVPTATSVPPTATSIPPTATSVPPTATPGTGGGCSVDYVIANDWGSGFVANVTIGSETAVSGWTLEFNFPSNQTITNLWGGVYSQSGNSVTVNNESWNGNIPANGTTSFGFQGTYSGNNAAPAAFSLNGSSCN